MTIGVYLWAIRSVTTEKGEELWMKIFHGVNMQFVYEQKVFDVRVVRLKMMETDEVATDRLISFTYN